MTQYSISIVSDTVCPWCYVGKNRLEKAIAQHKATYPEDTFETSWHPFYLNPHAPRDSIDKQAYYQRRFGPERTAMMQDYLARVGRDVGIKFSFGGRTGNTRDSHRLIALSKSKGEAMQTRVVEELFNSYFEANEDITSTDVLVARAVKAGLDEAEVRKWLSNDSGGDEVDREVAEANDRVITGVPFFTINGKHQVHGAEEPESFVRIFNKIKSQSSNGGVVNGHANLC